MLSLGAYWYVCLAFAPLGFFVVATSKSADVDNPLQLAHPVKEIQRRIVRPVQFDVEGHFGVVLLRLRVLRRVAPQFHARLLRLGVQHGDETIHLLFIGNDALLDFQLLFELGQLLLDLLQLGPVGLELVVFPNLVFEGMLRGRVVVVLALEQR